MKKIISITLAITILLSLSSVVMADVGFSDVDATDYSWAYSQIYEMADKKIINGYPDGTFKPDNGITKIESLLLISRILGVNNDAYSQIVNDIYKLYEEEIEELDVQYKNEIAFLIYKGVFTFDEIKELIDNDELNKPLLRHEAAIYLTKTLEADANVANMDTGYEDELDIPKSSRGYVKYVKDMGIMQGMTATTFEPMFKVNRAQMAVMLYRVLDTKDFNFVIGKLEDSSKNEINIKLSSGSASYDITETDFYLNGEETKRTDIKENIELVLVFENTILKRVECIYIVPEISETVVGEIKEIVLTSVKTLKIANSATNKDELYSVLPTCEVYVGNSVATLSVLRTKDNAKLYLDDEGNVFRVDVLDITNEFSDGVIQKLSYEDLKVDILRKDGTVETYFVSDNIVVIRNSKEVSMSNLLVGDQITKVIVRYNKIDKLQVKSEVGSSSGRISEIVISKDSSIVVNRDGVETRYPLTKSIKVFLDDEECEVYDLRLDMVAQITTDSGAVTEINVKTVEEISQISGVVELVNPSYGFINVKCADGTTQQVFVSNTTKITADGAVTGTKTIKNIYEGDYVVVIGRTVNGAFQATTIVIVAQ